jgi:hypothetical protein
MTFRRSRSTSARSSLPADMTFRRSRSISARLLLPADMMFQHSRSTSACPSLPIDMKFPRSHSTLARLAAATPPPTPSTMRHRAPCTQLGPLGGHDDLLVIGFLLLVRPMLPRRAVHLAEHPYALAARGGPEKRHVLIHEPHRLLVPYLAVLEPMPVSLSAPMGFHLAELCQVPPLIRFPASPSLFSSFHHRMQRKYQFPPWSWHVNCDVSVSGSAA